MDQQTPEQGRRELQDHIDRFFDQVLRVEREMTLSSGIGSRPQARNGQSGMPSPDRQDGGIENDFMPGRVSFTSTEGPRQWGP